MSMPRALNRAATKVRSEAVKRVARDMGLKQKDARRSFQIVRATRAKPEAVIIITGKPIGLIKFGARQTRRGVTAKAWGKRKLYKGAFIAPTSGSGGVQAFKLVGGRRGKPRARKSGPQAGRPYRPELPINKLFGPSVPQTFADREVLRFVNRVAVITVDKNFQRDMDFFMRRLAARR